MSANDVVDKREREWEEGEEMEREEEESGEEDGRREEGGGAAKGLLEKNSVSTLSFAKESAKTSQ